MTQYFRSTDFRFLVRNQIRVPKVRYVYCICIMYIYIKKSKITGIKNPLRQMSDVKNSPSKNMVNVGPYLTYHDHFVLKGVLKHICTIHMPHLFEVKVVKRDYFFTSA